MTTLATDASIQECVDAFAALEETVNSIDPDGQSERKINKVIAVSGGSYTAYIRKVMEEIDRDFQESYEKFRMWAEEMRAQIQRITKHALHRTQGRSSSKGKTSSKKSAGASGGNGGGDGGGDGDGPHRTRSKQSRRSSKLPTKYPPCSSPGAITPLPPQSPSPSRSQGMAQLTLLFALNCVLIVILLAMEERELASIALGSGSISALLSHLKKEKPDKEAND